MKKTSIIAFVLFLFVNQLLAQQYGNFKKVPFAIGLFPPVSTNGNHAGNCVNQVSLNLVSGYSGGLAGIEFAGFSNTERDFVHGAQVAGFGNYVAGEFTGFQFSGFGNFNKGISNGFQFAGFSNFNYNQADGVLAAGFFNFTKGKSFAIQAAGFANFCQDIEGVQAAGYFNIVKGNGKATQLAGLANITLGEVNGIQVAGLFNYSYQKMENVQAAGFVNISSADVKGVQIAGLLNVARKVNGIQLGFINLADTIESGVPVGFLSIVKKGFKEMEVSFSEGLNAQACFKIGVNRFYNIFAIGSQVFGSDYSWGIGYGIGTHLTNNDHFKTQLELISFHINEGEAWTHEQNELNQAKLTFTKKASGHFSIFAGPTFNLMISDNTDEHNHPFTSNFAPYKMASHSGKYTTLQGWIGFTAGIRIN